MKKIILIYLLFISNFSFANTYVTFVEEIKEEKVIVLTTTDYSLVSNIQGKYFLLGLNKGEVSGKMVYELILNDTDATKMYLRNKIDYDALVGNTRPTTPSSNTN